MAQFRASEPQPTARQTALPVSPAPCHPKLRAVRDPAAVVTRKLWLPGIRTTGSLVLGPRWCPGTLPAAVW